MRSTVATRLCVGAAVVMLSIWMSAPSVFADAGGQAPAGHGRSTEHRKAESAPRAHGQQDGDAALDEPQPASNADFSGNGANEHGAYDSTRDGSPSANGNGDGAATGQPCAGCVGKADNKNPIGQLPDGSDANNGYECDGNSGIAKTNPAHTGCLDVASVSVGDTTASVLDVAAVPASVLGVSLTAPIPAAVLSTEALTPALATTGSAIHLGRLALAGLTILLVGVALRLTTQRQRSFESLGH